MRKLSNLHGLKLPLRVVSLRIASRTIESGIRIFANHLHAQGCGVFGALGQGDDLIDSTDFQRIKLLNTSSKTTVVTNASAGWGHSVVLTSDGQVHVFGRPYDFSILMQINTIRRISHFLARFVGKLTRMFGVENNGLFSVPNAIEGIEPAASVHCAAGLTLIRTKSGILYAFGQNRWGQCGIGDDKTLHIYNPVKVAIPCKVKQVDVGLQHCVALSEIGDAVYTWGKGSRGQLGILLKDSVAKPQKVPKLNGLFTSVSSGFNHTSVLSVNGDVFVWGKGMSDVLKTEKSAGNLHYCT